MAIYKKRTANIILKGEKLKLFLHNQEQDKDAHSHHFHSTQRWKSWTEPLGKKKKEKPSKRERKK